MPEFFGLEEFNERFSHVNGARFEGSVPGTMSFTLDKGVGVRIPDMPYELIEKPLDGETLDGYFTPHHSFVLLNATSTYGGPIGGGYVKADHLVTGVRIAGLEGPFDAMSVQCTGLTQFIGAAPWVSADPLSSSSTALVRDDRSSTKWVGNDVTIELGYWPVDGLDLYRPTMAPVLSFVSHRPLDVDTWFETWVEPAIAVISTFTRHQQHLTWVKAVPTNNSYEQRPDAPALDRSMAEIFTSRLQRPFFTTDQREPQWPPLYSLTLNDWTFDLPLLLTKWRALESSHGLFLELMTSVQTYEELPVRARFLYLVQALETLDSIEVGDGPLGVDIYKSLRRHAVRRVQVAGELTTATKKFIKRWMTPVGRWALDQRLTRIVAQMPAQLVDAFDHSSFGSEVSKMRNKLSHGASTYSPDELTHWANLTEIVATCRLLQLLGVEDTLIIGALLPQMPTAS